MDELIKSITPHFDKVFVYYGEHTISIYGHKDGKTTVIQITKLRAQVLPQK